MSDDKPLSKKEALEMLQEIDDDGVGLTNYEVNFIDSMMKWIDNKNPTVNQSKCLRKIYRERL